MKIFRHILAALGLLVFLGAITTAHLYSSLQVSHLLDGLVHSLHGPGFAVVAIILLAVLRQYRHGSANYLLAGTAAMAIAVLAEAAQIPGPRDADIADLIVDGIGIIGGLGCVALLDQSLVTMLGKRLKLALALVSMTALAVTVLPTLWFAYAIVEQRLATPQLMTFEHHWESAALDRSSRRRVKLQPAPVGWPEIGDTVALAQASDRWGVLMRLHPYPDWRSYSTFSFIAASGSKSTHDVILSIWDTRPTGIGDSNGFSQLITVGPEPTRYSISLDRVRDVNNGHPFDDSHVESVLLRAARPGRDVSILLDDFRLEL